MYDQWTMGLDLCPHRHGMQQNVVGVVGATEPVGAPLPLGVHCPPVGEPIDAERLPSSGLSVRLAH